MLGFNAVFSEGGHGACPYGVVGNGGDEFRLMTVVSEGNGYVGFAAAVVDVEFVCLNEFSLLGVESLSIISPIVTIFDIFVFLLVECL